MIMPNMDPKKCPMPVQDPDVRNKNFKEVALGYTYEMAVNEAKRCLNCKNKPCVSGCPVNIDIPAFIAKVADEDMEGAYAVLSASSALPAVCGRVCPQENQCEGKCVRGIKTESVGIGRLERFVADWHREHSTEKPAMPVPNGHRVAVIGSGPPGLTAAGDLAQLGEKQETLEAEKAELEEQIAAAVEVINKLQDDIDAAKAEYAKAAAAEAAAQASINAIIAQMQAEEEAARQEAAQNNQQYTGTGSTATGTYIWPCPSSTYVTSAFGMRDHPLFGDERPHSGIDIAGSAGSEVLAADSGTVAVATYSSSYGNYVTIYHSNGDYTLYAHMSSLAVSAGQSVTQGDVIGYVGSTGWATGPHLHFEIRVNGSTVDPLSYFSNYTLAPDA